MTITELKNENTLRPLSVSSEDELSLIEQKLAFCDEIVINMSEIDDCSSGFLRLLREYKNRIRLVNTDSKILSLIYITGFDRYVKIFEDEVGLYDDRRELVNRKLSIVN